MPEERPERTSPEASPRTSHGDWTLQLGSDAVAGVLARAMMIDAAHGVGEAGSTQDVALDLARDGVAGGVVVVADRQLQGRGRRGRRWDDAPDGGSLAMTVLLDAPSHSVTLVPLAVGLAVAQAVEHLTGAGATRAVLKWPNDVVVREPSGPEGGPLRKLAGILVQQERVASRDVLLVGVGLNVDHRGLPPEPDRICLATLQPELPGRGVILAGLIAALDRRLHQLLSDAGPGPRSVLHAYRAASDTLGRQVDVELPDGRRFTGTAQDLDATGALVVEVDGRTEVVISGTVRTHGKADACSTSGSTSGTTSGTTSGSTA